MSRKLSIVDYNDRKQAKEKESLPADALICAVPFDAVKNLIFHGLESLYGHTLIDPKTIVPEKIYAYTIIAPPLGAVMTFIIEKLCEGKHTAIRATRPQHEADQEPASIRAELNRYIEAYDSPGMRPLLNLLESYHQSLEIRYWRNRLAGIRIGDMLYNIVMSECHRYTTGALGKLTPNERAALDEYYQDYEADHSTTLKEKARKFGVKFSTLDKKKRTIYDPLILGKDQ